MSNPISKTLQNAAAKCGSLDDPIAESTCFNAEISDHIATQYFRDDFSVEERTALIKKLRGTGGAVAVPALVRVIEEENPYSNIVAAAFNALGNIGPAAKLAVPAIMKSAFWVGHPFSKTAKYISSFHKRGYFLGSLWEMANRSLRSQAAAALTQIGEEAIPEILEGIMRGDEEKQIFCAEVLGNLEGKIGKENQRVLSYAAPRVVPKLMDGIERVHQEWEKNSDKSRDEYEKMNNQRDLYVKALTQFQEAAVPYLIDALPADSEKDFLGSTLAEALTKIGEPAVPALAKIFAQEDGSRLDLAFGALEKMGRRAKEATPVLVDFFGCTDVQNSRCERNIYGLSISTMAAGILRNIGKEALPYILSLLNDPKPSVRSAAMRAYGDFMKREYAPQFWRDFIFAMIEKLQDPAPEVVAAAVSLLGEIAPENKSAYFALPLLCSIRDDSDQKENLRNSAKSAIKAIEDKVL